ncbi:MAG: cell division protein FtsQ/DivIB [Betaproteobacteria bacterium]|nr:cell division protein FtsQ/DivIB [Betaproteobacteria bacterium]
MKSIHMPASLPAVSLMRRRAVVLGAAAVAALLAAGLVGWLGSRSWPQLPLKVVTFKGAIERVDQGDLARVVQGLQGDNRNLLRVDLEAVRGALRQVDWVRDVTVRRRLPDTLEVTVEEHRLFARWQVIRQGDAASGPAAEDEDDAAADDELWLVNVYGELFRARVRADEEAGLPLFSGPADTAGEVLTRFQGFGQVLQATARTPREVHLSSRRAWQVVLDNGSVLALGRDDVDARLARFVKAYAVVPVLQTAGVRVDLRYRTGLAVRRV